MTAGLLLLALTSVVLTTAGLYLAILAPRVGCSKCGHPFAPADFVRDGDLHRARCPDCDASSSWVEGEAVSFRAPMPRRAAGGLRGER
jgi:hypothetical protein